MFKTILACVLLTPCLLWQNVSPKVDSPQGKLLALEKMWNQAQLMRDSSALEGLVGEHFINTEWDGEVTNRDKFLAEIRDPQFKPNAMSIEDVQVNLYGNTAVVTGAYHTKGSYQGKPYDHLGRFTDTWIFDGHKWECVASHSSLMKK
jgi:hypothetical protein